MSGNAGTRCYIGIDVGTASARAGIFDGGGRKLGAALRVIEVWHPQADFVEQSSEDIWQGVCGAVRSAMAQAGIGPEDIRGIGFDATCSLVALRDGDQPLTVSPGGKADHNVIVWMDHRAQGQAERINATKHKVLTYVGGAISPEMETPKLLWIKENLPRSWQAAARFFDLPDFLTYRATGDDTRSLCSTVCKWTYLGHEDAGVGGGIGRWDETFFRQVGLGDLVDEGYRRIGTRVRPMGEPVGNGLTRAAAAELGLRPGTPVGVSIIDAHAGGLGVLGADVDGVAPTAGDWRSRLALIGGTSSCHMAVSPEARFIPGVWGPYFSAMIPGLWLTEGGQSATGALVDYVIFTHARSAELKREADAGGKTVYEVLNDWLARLVSRCQFPGQLTRDLHVLPYFHGNRSPRADATLRGMISGLTLGDTLDDLATLYLAVIQAIAHGTRHIIETMNQHGYGIETIFACGGGTKNSVFLREHADVTGCRIVLPREAEAVLLGSAILGAVAAGDFGTVADAMAAMSSAGEIVAPTGGTVAEYHAKKHAVFQRLYEDQLAYRRLME